jgi:DNA-binding MarR family transcriptional regulator
MFRIDRIISLTRIVHVTRTIGTTTPGSSPLTGTRTSERIGEIFAEFMGAIRELRCATGQQLVRAGVSMTHLHLMWVLERHGDLPMSRLAEILDVSLSSATGIVDRMEERGLVDRVRVPDDRRVVLVRISDRGREVLRQTDLIKEDLMAEIASRLDDRQRERLARTMADVRDATLAILAERGLSPGQPHDHHRADHDHQRPERQPVSATAN